MALEHPHLIWIDCEMTGLDLEKDVLVEIAVLVTDSELEQRESRASFDGLGGAHQCFERAAGPQSL